MLSLGRCHKQNPFNGCLGRERKPCDSLPSPHPPQLLDGPPWSKPYLHGSKLRPLRKWLPFVSRCHLELPLLDKMVHLRPLEILETFFFIVSVGVTDRPALTPLA